jgi:deoxyribose-phosphate aldolase
VCTAPVVPIADTEGSFPVRRRPLTVEDVASRLEHRLYLSAQTREAVDGGCAFAVSQGLSSVIALPEVVPTVAGHLAGTSVGVVTIPGWRDGNVERLATGALLTEAERLADGGATDLGMLADAERLGVDDGRGLGHDVSALVDAMRARAVRVRVVLDTDGLTPEATAAACEMLGATGVWLVQGGSWRGARTGLTRIQLMRSVLPDGVKLKWTFPVRSLDSMIICIAEGVDLFNGEPQVLVADAARRLANGPLLVPVKGVDF